MVFIRPSAVGDVRDPAYKYRGFRTRERQRKRAANIAARRKRARAKKRYGLTPRQADLFCALPYYKHSKNIWEAVAAVYGPEKPSRSPNLRRKYLHRLRTLVCELNKKLRAHHLAVRRPTPETICLMNDDVWRRHGEILKEKARKQKRGRYTRREVVNGCAYAVRRFLAKGDQLVSALDTYLRYWKPGTIRAAKRAAGVRTYRDEFGGAYMAAISLQSTNPDADR